MNLRRVLRLVFVGQLRLERVRDCQFVLKLDVLGVLSLLEFPVSTVSCLRISLWLSVALLAYTKRPLFLMSWFFDSFEQIVL